MSDSPFDDFINDTSFKDMDSDFLINDSDNSDFYSKYAKNKDSQALMEVEEMTNGVFSMNHMAAPNEVGSRGEKVVNCPTTRKSLPEYRARDAGPKKEEEEGKLVFRLITNEGSRENLKILIFLKNVFSKQLPKMPVEYICRLVLDKKHIAMAMIKEGVVIGGIHFRPFPERNFIEIVFLAVTQQKQVSGYGSHLMNHLKAYAQAKNMYNFLTYADNYAIGFFKKQGFSKDIELPREYWVGVIKDYEGGTLMHCNIMDKIHYMDISRIVHNQRLSLLKKLTTLSIQHVIWEGMKDFKNGSTRLALENFQPLLDMGWNPAQYIKLTSPEVQSKIYSYNSELLRVIREDKYSWPFLEPVDGTQVVDYYTTILDPIDLSTMQVRLNQGYYITQEMLIADIQRMINNCKRYNGSNTEYYTCAVQIENRLKRWKTLPINLK